MNCFDIENSVNELYEATGILYNDLKTKVDTNTLNVDFALEQIKEFSIRVAEIGKNLLIAQCNAGELSISAYLDTSFEKQQKIEEWVRKTTKGLLRLKFNPGMEQGILDPWPK